MLLTNTTTSLTPITTGGKHLFAATGTFDGATVKLQHSVGGSFIDIPNASFTTDGSVVVESPLPLKVVATSTGANTSVTVEVAGFDE